MADPYDLSIIVATCGEERWSTLGDALARITASAVEGDFIEVVRHHYSSETVSGARNRAAGEANGRWLCFLDADDFLSRWFWLRMKSAVRREEYAWDPPAQGVFSSGTMVSREPRAILAPGVAYVHDDGTVEEPRIPNQGRWPDLNECVIGSLIPARVFREVGGFRELAALEDWDLWLRAVAAGCRIVHVQDAVYHARVREGSRNSDQSLYHRIKADNIEVFNRA